MGHRTVVNNTIVYCEHNNLILNVAATHSHSSIDDWWSVSSLLASLSVMERPPKQRDRLFRVSSSALELEVTNIWLDILLLDFLGDRNSGFHQLSQVVQVLEQQSNPRSSPYHHHPV